MVIVEFFRDTLSGIWYFLYLLVCLIAFFYVLGIVADNKRERINKKLKEKKTFDIESGKEAQIAAMETKQVLAVDDGELTTTNNNVKEEEQKKEEVPAVVVLNSEPQVKPVVESPVIQPAVVEPQTQTPQVEAPKKNE